MNRATIFVGSLAFLMFLVGLYLMWLSIMLGSWIGIIVSLAWAGFTGGCSVYAWKTRYEP